MSDTNRRTTVLTAILLGLLALYFGRQYLPDLLERFGPASARGVVPGKNAIRAAILHQTPAGDWQVEVEYFYTGEPRPLVIELWAYQAAASGPANPAGWPLQVRVFAQGTGEQHQLMTIPQELARKAVSTDHVRVSLVQPGPPAQVAIASTDLAQRIDFVDWQTGQARRETVGKESDQVVSEAVTLIDAADNENSEAATAADIDRARGLLQHVVAQDPNADAAYVELARVAMKSNWGPEGLRQAETLIGTALRLKPGSANAQILMGYVQAHQGRFAEAEALFAEAAKSKPRNLWLWTNWGELREMQGQPDAAMEKYRHAIEVPPTHDTYDRARQGAFSKMGRLLQRRQAYAEDDALEVQYAKDYFAPGCESPHHAEFLLLHRGETDHAIAIATKALAAECGHVDADHSRRALGLAFYVKWSEAPAARAATLLDQARAQLPPGAEMLRMLATDDRTLPVVRRLAAAGESIDQLDNDRLDALALALTEDDLPAARRLLAAGARPDAIVGLEPMPVAWLPVSTGDVEAVRMLQRQGVDYATLRFHGHTALDVARASGKEDMVKLLAKSASTPV